MKVVVFAGYAVSMSMAARYTKFHSSKAEDPNLTLTKANVDSIARILDACCASSGICRGRLKGAVRIRGACIAFVMAPCNDMIVANRSLFRFSHSAGKMSV